MIHRLLTLLSAALSAGAVSAATPQQLIDIRTDDVSMVLAARSGGEVYFRHFGGRIDDPAPLSDYKSSRRADHGTDDLAYPAMGGRNFREPALRVTHADGDMNTDLRYVSHTSRQLADPNVTETVVKMSDSSQALDVELVFTAYARENVITTHAVIRNREQGPVTLHSFYSSALTLKADKYLLTHLYGAWAREAQVDHTLLTHGSKSIESMREVRTTHTENPSFMLTLGSDAFSENCGEVIAGALAWSGNFRLNFEVDEYDALTILAGANPNASEYRLRPGESFTTPEMIYTHSLRGAGGASRNLHDWGRNYGVYHAERVVPTLLNSWEGAYFDFDAKVLKQMIDDAASMGLEMFVLDDGWFGNKYPRNAANAGLGDWQVNQKKLPAGIDDIASYAHRKGLKFGIWIEPEMVNPKSELAEKHPDWIVRPPKRDAPETRRQWLLDLSNPAVQDFVFETFDNTMKLSDKIDYIKWDANRNANNVGSAYLPADEQSHFWIDYAQGFYRVMERIRAKYPDVLIQACASGGGRVEYGALRYFDEFWTSDNTEALSRARIQYGTSLFYPAVAMGSHVSAVPNHQTGNVTPIKFRFDMACAGRLGMELQPKQMTDAEKEFARRAIASYKEYRDIVMQGDLYRIGTPYDESGSYGVLYVSKDKRQAVLFAYSLHYQGRSLIPKFRLDGLDPKAGYAVRELNVDKPRFWFDGKTLSGELLMNAGINPHLSKIYDSAVFVLKAQ
ncbi:alpha-galactosidase [Alistipes provencensis]|uniref:alpha-galactosidase n=1 Tax=Alistipes provencensis TaxID=1816676 RepID=UPI0007EC496E|nr:alpha-galactosidase [Alistipes provencensis]